MGTDDLFHKRKARQAESHRRKIASRAPYERVLNLLEDKLDRAMLNAKKLGEYHLTSGTDNPSTNVHDLITYLREMKDTKET